MAICQIAKHKTRNVDHRNVQFELGVLLFDWMRKSFSEQFYKLSVMQKSIEKQDTDLCDRLKSASLKNKFIQ